MKRKNELDSLKRMRNINKIWAKTIDLVQEIVLMCEYWKIVLECEHKKIDAKFYWLQKESNTSARLKQ